MHFVSSHAIIASVMKMKSFQYNASNISVFCAEEVNPDPAAFSMHTHSFAELFCFLGGEGTFHIEGSTYPLSPGDIVLMRPGEAHYIAIEPDIPYSRAHVTFDTQILMPFDPDNILMRPYFDRKSGKQNLYRRADFENEGYLDNLMDMLRTEGNSHAAILANLILLLQKIGVVFDHNQSLTPAEDSVEYRIIRYINKNLHTELTLDELCGRFFISRAQLCRRFKKATGTSVGRYIAVKRLLACRQLIAQGQKPTEVYTVYGYQDYSTFYRAYRQYFGSSPKDPVTTAPPAIDRATIL